MAQLEQRGYQVGNLEQLDARFKCNYCMLLLRDPMQGDCGHRYCRNCVQIKFNEAKSNGQASLCAACDASERAEISPDRTYPDIAIKREIFKSLKVLCPNKSCEEKMSLDKLEDHLTQCDYRPKPCDLCGQLVSGVTLSEHKDATCPKRLMECEVCKLSVPADTMAAHKSNECIGSTVQCEFCLARVKDDEEAKDSHWRSSCPAGWHEKNPCPFGCAEMADGWRQHRLQCQATHVDRLLIRSKQKPEQAADKQQSEGARSLLVTDSSGRDAAAVSMPASELAGVDYDELNSLKDRARAIERRLNEAVLPASVLLGESGDQEKAKKYLGDLNTALAEGGKMNDLLTAIKEQFDTCYEKIRQYELKMQKDLEKKLDIERKHQELVKLLAYKEMKILDLERRIEILEHAGYDGVLIWKITDVRRRKEEAREGKVCSIYSPPFYTGKAGYKMCGRLYLNGDGAGKNTHISLFFVIMRGAFDALLPWPFSKKVSMMLLDQNFEEHVIDAFKPDTSSSSFKRPTTDMNIASGCPLFMPLGDFENGSRGYVKDDTMFIKFIVDKSDLPT